MAWQQLIWGLAVWTIRYPLPIGLIGGLYYFQYEKASLNILVLYGIYLFVRLAWWPRRFLRRKKENAELKKSDDLMKEMLTIYYYCQPSVMSPRTLKEQLDKAKEKGVLLHGAVFAILDRIISQDSSVFIPFQTATNPS